MKSPKIFWRDSGLLHALLGIRRRDDLWPQPWVGQSWEGWVIGQVLSHLQAMGRDHDAWFFRTSDGWEADLLLRTGKEMYVIEIKLTTEPAPEDFRRLARLTEMVGGTQACLISRTKRPVFSDKGVSSDLPAFLSWIAPALSLRS